LPQIPIACGPSSIKQDEYILVKTKPYEEDQAQNTESKEAILSHSYSPSCAINKQIIILVSNTHTSLTAKYKG